MMKRCKITPVLKMKVVLGAQPGHRAIQKIGECPKPGGYHEALGCVKFGRDVLELRRRRWEKL